MIRKFYNGGSIDEEEKTKKLQNHNQLKPGITVEAMDKALSAEGILAIFNQDYLSYLEKMDACFEELTRDPSEKSTSQTPSSASEEARDTGKGLWLKRWTVHKSCKELRREFLYGSDLLDIIENYCEPTLAP